MANLVPQRGERLIQQFCRVFLPEVRAWFAPVADHQYRVSGRVVKYKYMVVKKKMTSNTLHRKENFNGEKSKDRNG